MKAQVAKAIPPTFVDFVGKLMKFEHTFSYAGQMFLLADLTSDTLARWNTLAYQMSGCAPANDVVTWDIEYTVPEALAPGTPTIIGGRVTNQQGQGGVAWPSGAIAPPGWYVQIWFELEARAIFTTQRVGLTTWIRRTDHGGYDFGGNRYPKGYPGQGAKGSYMLTTQNTDAHFSSQYVMMAMSDELALTTELKAHCQASRLPPADWSLDPLGCIRDLSVEHINDPANRNPKPRYPNILARWIGEHSPVPVHGPPGGKPRTKK